MNRNRMPQASDFLQVIHRSRASLPVQFAVEHELRGPVEVAIDPRAEILHRCIQGFDILCVGFFVQRFNARHQVVRFFISPLEHLQEPFMIRVQQFVVREDESSAEEHELADRRAEQVAVVQAQGFAAVPVPGFELGVKPFDALRLVFDRILRRFLDLGLEPVYFAEQHPTARERETRRFAALLGDLPHEPARGIFPVHVAAGVGDQVHVEEVDAVLCETLLVIGIGDEDHDVDIGGFGFESVRDGTAEEQGKHFGVVLKVFSNVLDGADVMRVHGLYESRLRR